MGAGATVDGLGRGGMGRPFDGRGLTGEAVRRALVDGVVATERKPLAEADRVLTLEMDDMRASPGRPEVLGRREREEVRVKPDPATAPLAAAVLGAGTLGLNTPRVNPVPVDLASVPNVAVRAPIRGLACVWAAAAAVSARFSGLRCSSRTLRSSLARSSRSRVESLRPGVAGARLAAAETGGAIVDRRRSEFERGMSDARGLAAAGGAASDWRRMWPGVAIDWRARRGSLAGVRGAVAVTRAGWDDGPASGVPSRSETLAEGSGRAKTVVSPFLRFSSAILSLSRSVPDSALLGVLAAILPGTAATRPTRAGPARSGESTSTSFPPAARRTGVGTTSDSSPQFIKSIPWGAATARRSLLDRSGRSCTAERLVGLDPTAPASERSRSGGEGESG